MRWLEIVIALAVAAVVVAFRVFSGPWCEPLQVRGGAALFIAVALAAYLHFVDHGRDGARAPHRILAGGLAGAAIAAVLRAPGEGYALGVLLGGALGYFGSHWTRHLRL